MGYELETFEELYKLSAVRSAIKASEETMDRLGLDDVQKKVVVAEAYEVIKSVLF